MPFQVHIAPTEIHHIGQPWPHLASHINRERGGRFDEMYPREPMLSQAAEPFVVMVEAVFRIKWSYLLPGRAAHDPTRRRREVVNPNDGALIVDLEMRPGHECAVLQSSKGNFQVVWVPNVVVLENGDIIARRCRSGGINGCSTRAG